MPTPKPPARLPLTLSVVLILALVLGVPAVAHAKRGLDFTTTVDLGFVTGTGHVRDLRLVTEFEPSLPGDVYCFRFTLQIDPIDIGGGFTLTQEPPTFTPDQGGCYTAQQLQTGITLDCPAGQVRFDGTGSETYVLGFRDSSTGQLEYYGVSWDIPPLTAEPGSKEAEAICALAEQVAAGTISDADYVKQLNSLLGRLSPE